MSAVKNTPDDILFRGQTGHYNDPDGRVSLPTSQFRQGCIPQELRRWSFLARDAIAWLRGPGGTPPDDDLVQALLQHYGWRSFFIDLTSNSGVAAWFASHSYSDQKLLFYAGKHQTPTLCIERAATYTPHNNTGHLYGISRARLKQLDTACFDLTESFADLAKTRGGTFKARFLNQAGWLAGPLGGDLDPSTVVLHVSGPAAVFREYAQINGYRESQDLFPNAESDTFLQLLQASPWEPIRKEGENHVIGFKRGLDVPNYEKYGQEPASFPIFDTIPPELKPAGYTYYVPDEMFYADPTPEAKLPFLVKTLKKHKLMFVETQHLIRLQGTPATELCKGFYIERTDDEFTIGILIVDHPGHQLTGCGSDRGWYYRINDHQITRIHHKNECPCDRVFRHEQLFRALTALDWLLANGTNRRITESAMELSVHGQIWVTTRISQQPEKRREVPTTVHKWTSESKL